MTQNIICRIFAALKEPGAFRLLTLCLAAAAMLPAQTWLPFMPMDGGNPINAPIQTASGALLGSAGNYGFFSNGTIYTLTSKGLAPFHAFNCKRSYCPEGASEGDWVQTPDGTIYGTGLSVVPHGTGTVYRIAPDGAFAVIHTLTSLEGYAAAGLMQAANRDFYGVTVFGGVNNSGTIFRLTADGAVTPIYSFCYNSGCPSPQQPTGGLVQAANGDLYGLTQGLVGNGTIYKLTPDGQYTTIYTFCSQSDCPDGNRPAGSLIEAADGNLYATSRGAGTFHKQSVILRVSADDQVTVFHTFTESFGNSFLLMPGSDGNLYGATDTKLIYRITLGGDVTVLYQIPSSLGYIAGMGQYTNGKLFAVTDEDPHDDGSILFFDAGLAPFVKVQPASSGAGSSVTIIGTGLTGATSVTFGGASAVFTVTSDYAISATVPAGATSGAVQVVTPQGTLSSDVPFFIL